eukprot:403339550
MNRTQLKRKEYSKPNSLHQQESKVRKTSSKQLLRSKMIAWEDASSKCQFQMCDDGGSAYLSDTLLSGVYTPYSTFSGTSRMTGISQNNKRMVKEQRKCNQNRYNLRQGIRKGLPSYGTQRTADVSQTRPRSRISERSHSQTLKNQREEFKHPQTQKLQSGESKNLVSEYFFLDEDPFFEENHSFDQEDSTFFCSQSFNNQNHRSLNVCSQNSQAMRKSKARDSEKNLSKVKQQALALSKPKKAKAPPCSKIFYEDKLSKDKLDFPLYDEKHLKFLKHKSLSSQQNQQLGNEDDHASDSGVIEAAKNLLKLALGESISKYLENPSSQLSNSGGHIMFREDSSSNENQEDIDPEIQALTINKSKNSRKLRSKSINKRSLKQ